MEVDLLFQIDPDIGVVPPNLSHVNDLLRDYLRVNVQVKNLHVSSKHMLLQIAHDVRFLIQA